MIAIITAMEVELRDILSRMENPQPVEKPGLWGYVGSLHGKTVLAAVCGVGKVCAAQCAQMEGAAVAHVCAVNRVPFAVVRCISDLANDDAYGDYEHFELLAAKKSADILCGAIAMMEEKEDVK